MADEGSAPIAVEQVDVLVLLLVVLPIVLVSDETAVVTEAGVARGAAVPEVTGRRDERCLVLHAVVQG